MRSAVAGLDIARTDYFPSLSLTGSASASSSSLTALVASPDQFINASASIVQTLLDTGQRSRALESRELAMESALATYRRTVLAAFNEDRDMIMAQHRNILRKPEAPMLPLAMDAALGQFRRLLASRVQMESTVAQA